MHIFNIVLLEKYKKIFSIKKDVFYHKYFENYNKLIIDKGIFLLDKNDFSSQINVALI